MHASTTKRRHGRVRGVRRATAVIVGAGMALGVGGGCAVNGTPLASPTVAPPASPAATRAIVPGRTGSFVFAGYAPLQDRPVRVWYSAPATGLRTARVLVVMHGQSRNADGYRDSWVKAARQAGALLIVPEFSASRYPGSAAYNLGNVGREPRARWTFAMIEPLFDHVRAITGNRTSRYFLYGHSAGAQFVHRFMQIVPDNRVERAVAANAGWYTVPEPGVTFPYGLAGAPITTAGLRTAFATRLTVLLGGADTDPNSPDLYHSAGADRQGMFRLARGRFFYWASAARARALGLPFRWRLQVVPGVGHTNGGMVPAAAGALFG